MTNPLARRGVALAALVFISSGCYRYVPTDADLVPPGDDIRILVTRLGAAELDQVTEEATAAGLISGKMQGVEDDDLILSVPVGERREGFMTMNLTQTIRVPMGEILDLDRREFDKGATVGMVGLAAALGVGIVFGIIEAFGTSSPGEDEPPVEDFTFVLGRFSLPFGG